MKSKINNWLSRSLILIISDVGKFGVSLYPLFVITCMIGVYINMAGSKEKGSKVSSISFLAYLILKVMESV